LIVNNDREQWETRSLKKVEVDDVLESLLVEMEKASGKLWKRLVACFAKRQLRKD